MTPGCVVGIAEKDNVKLVVAEGRLTYDAATREVHQDTIYDVASVTKSVPTASLALALIDQGRLSLEDKVISYIPEFDNNFREDIRIRHLLTNTLDFGDAHLSAFKKEAPADIMREVLHRDLTCSPGEKFYYTNIASILLGFVVERIFGKKLDAAADEMFFKPLHMNRTGFHPDASGGEDIAPTEIDEWRGGAVCGEVHDESAWALQRGGIVPGSAGLFSTVPDLLIFLSMLLCGGASYGTRYFSKDMIEQMTSNQLGAIGESQGLGFEVDRSWMGSHHTPRTFGKTGFTGCAILGDLDRGVGIAILSNLTYPHRRERDEHVRLSREFRRDIADIVWDAHS